jgi:hypothetical protein
VSSTLLGGRRSAWRRNVLLDPQALGGAIRLAARKTHRPIYVTKSGIGTDDDARRAA